MTRTLLNLLIDLAAAALILGLMATGYILRFPLPPGSNRILSLWGLTRHQWGAVHFWISTGLLSILLVHLVLHWNWLFTVIRQRLHAAKGSTAAMYRTGLATTLIVAGSFAAFAWAAHVCVTDVVEPWGDICPPHKEPTADIPPPSISADKKNGDMDFWKEIYPVLSKNCLSCHGPARQKAGFRVDLYDSMFGTLGGTAWVVPGKSSQSPLMEVVTGQRADLAHPDRHKLSSAEAEVIRRWIDAGAAWPKKL